MKSNGPMAISSNAAKPVAHVIASVGATGALGNGPMAISSERSRVRCAHRLIKASRNGNFVKELHGHFAYFVKRPNPLDLALEVQSAITPHKQFINGRPATSRPAPVAALSRTAQWLFYENRPSHKSAITVLSRPMAVLSRPMAVLSRGALAASRPG